MRAHLKIEARRNILLTLLKLYLNEQNVCFKSRT